MIATMLMFAAATAPTPIVNCAEIDKDLDRLHCYDTERRRKPTEPNKGEIATPEQKGDAVTTGRDNITTSHPKIRFRLHNDATPFPGPNASFGAKAASLTAERDSGETFVLANAAAIVLFDPPSEYGWQPYLIAQWKRSENADKRSDVRIFGAGVGTYLAPKNVADGLGANFWPMLMRRKDIYQDIESTVASLQIDLVRNAWVGDLESDTENAYAFTPYVGVVLEDRETEGDDDGRWSSAYAGAEWNAKLSQISPRLLLTMKYMYFRDWSSPSTTDKRSEDFAHGSVAYEFTDPKDTSIKVRPSISLSREVGINPLIGPVRLRETKLTFGLKIDTY